ncbi:MAG: hypothetical protein IH614_19295, partial [Desulfuromonadales bacterium]|nr:hypothetical protein [Desulfuromonadales bacterium]
MRFVLPLLLFAAILSSSQLQAGDYRYTLGIGIEYSTGDYGTEETTDSWAVPLTLRWMPTDRLDFEFVLPYIHQSASTTVQMGGKRFPYQGGDGSGNTGTGNPDSGTGNPDSGSGNPDSGSGIQSAQVAAEAGATTATSRSESGLGDADLTVGFTVFHEGERAPLVRSLAYLKFPTGDESSGL